jgi:hypothetical protein
VRLLLGMIFGDLLLGYVTLLVGLYLR